MDMEMMMAATARLVVQMTAAEKTRLDAQARRLGITTSEFVRRRVADDDLIENREEIELLLAALADAAPRILGHLDHSIAEAESALEGLRKGQS